ncbi:ATP-binding protein [Phenylobacterium sp.]|uniref:hybrid sensor histidine kinase/response regulator n=1 Tax=Phenylobacterium sp. TaxID=1871053 RepID=UPI0035B191FD
MAVKGLRALWSKAARNLGRWLGGRALAQAEAEARLARDRLSAALDALPEGIVFLDAQGRYILWNKRYAEIYHRSADLFSNDARLADTLKIGVARGDYPEAVGREADWLAERLAQLENPTGERHEQRLADGRWLMLEERRTADGGVIGLRVDITELKRQAQALEEALQRAEAASRARSAFLANVSHELLTPLNGISGMAQLLGQTPLSDQQGEMLRTIGASAHALETLIGGLLDYNNLEAGKVTLEPAWFSAPDLLAQAVAAFRPAAEAKGLSLTVEVAPSATLEAYGDARRLRQLLDHLIANAIKFTTEGRVTVSAMAQPAREGALFAFEVRDTGPGFDDSDAERLFGQFQQADASTTREHGGVGLGLAVCRRLADLIGGTITARSRPGEGASFTVVAPMPARPIQSAPPTEEPARALRVLLADDNATNRRVLEMFLAVADAQVVSVENGLEAVQAAAGDADFDVVLMDLHMPVMDGLTAIREIRRFEARAAARTPIIVISANASSEDREASAEAGADRHIAKPVRAEELFGVIAEVLAA